jgi:hypothetical protein
MRILDYYNPDSSDLALPAEPLALRRYVILKRLTRILAFTHLTIDDVVNNPIAKNQVRYYYKVAKQIDRQSEIIDLEKQWNPNA